MSTLTDEEMDQMARTAAEKLFKLVDALAAWLEAKTQTETRKTYERPLGQ